MADFPEKLGQRNGGNARIIRGLCNGVFKDSFCGDWWWVVNLKHSTTTLEADTSQVFTLNTLFSGNPFPTNVVRKQGLIYVEDAVEGGSISAATAILGDAGNDDALIEAATGSVFTAGVYNQSTAAAEFAPRFEAAFSPIVTLATTGDNVDDSTFSLWVMILFSPVASVT